MLRSGAMQVASVRSWDGLLAELFSREPLFAGTALVLAALAVLAALGLFLDPRTLDSANVWLKPLKFAVSLSVFLMTLAWFAAWLPAGVTQQAWYRPFTLLIVACVALEMIWIGGSAALGLRSHFNTDIAFLRAVYPIMGLVATCLLSVCLVYGVLILGNGQSALSPALRHAVGLGLILTFLLTLVVAWQMAGAGPPVRLALPAPTGEAGWLAAATGWRLDLGDLRPAHFAATHALQILPLIVWLLDRTVPLSTAAGALWTLIAVWAAALLYSGFVIYLFLLALRVQSIPAAT